MNTTSISKQIILVVEDHELLRSIIQKWLEELYPDFEIIEAVNGEDGVKLAQSLEPRLVIMDIGLPGMNGITATKLIKKNLPQTQVIVLTIFNDAFYEKEAKKAGAVAFVSKSDMYVQLPELLKTLLLQQEKSTWN